MKITKSNTSVTPKKILRIGGKATVAPAVVTTDTKQKALGEMLGKAVFFGGEKAQRIAGQVKRVEANGDLVVNLAVPSREGLLMVTDSEVVVKASDLEVTQALMQQKRVRAFECGAAITLSADQKAITIFDKDDKGKDTDVICDYQNVIIEGHASTFGSPDKRDRGGDYVMPGAWSKTLADFRKNPVMLLNHDNCVECVAGSWAKIGVDGVGLGVTGVLSNAPGLRDVRFKLMEGHLKGLSIGGIWYYKDDGFGIEEADLYEISLVGIPMNPETLATTRKLTEAECRKAFAKFWSCNTDLKAA